MGVPLWKSGAVDEPIEVDAGFDLLFEIDSSLVVPNSATAGFDLLYDVQASIDVPCSVSAGFDLLFEVKAEITDAGNKLQAGFDLLFDVNAELSGLLEVSAGFDLLFDVSGNLSVPTTAPPEYSCLAVQGMIGDSGRKATTLIPAYAFGSLGEINGVPIGLNNSGLYRLMVGELVDGQSLTRSFTLKEHHLGYPGSLKKIRFIYLSCGGDPMFLRVHTKADDDPWQPCYGYVKHGRGLRCAANAREQGVYWSIKVESERWFRIDDIKISSIIRPPGVSK